MDLKSRIFKFIEYKGITISEFERNSTLANGYLKKFKGSIGSDKLNSISNYYPELSLEWLITGKGPMLKSTEASTEDEEETEKDRFYQDIIFTYQEAAKDYRKKIEYLEAELAKAAPFAGEEKKKQSKSA